MPKPEDAGDVDYYAILGVERHATDAVVKAHYRRQALLLHPDRHTGQEEVYKAKFQVLQTAYGVLSDPNKRLIYNCARSEHEKRYSRTKASSATKTANMATKTPTSRTSRTSRGFEPASSTFRNSAFYAAHNKTASSDWNSSWHSFNTGRHAKPDAWSDTTSQQRRQQPKSAPSHNKQWWGSSRAARAGPNSYGYTSSPDSSSTSTSDSSGRSRRQHPTSARRTETSSQTAYTHVYQAGAQRYDPRGTGGNAASTQPPEDSANARAWRKAFATFGAETEGREKENHMTRDTQTAENGLPKETRPAEDANGPSHTDSTNKPAQQQQQERDTAEPDTPRAAAQPSTQSTASSSGAHSTPRDVPNGTEMPGPQPFTFSQAFHDSVPSTAGSTGSMSQSGFKGLGLKPPRRRSSKHKQFSNPSVSLDDLLDPFIRLNVGSSGTDLNTEVNTDEKPPFSSSSSSSSTTTSRATGASASEPLASKAGPLPRTSRTRVASRRNKRNAASGKTSAEDLLDPFVRLSTQDGVGTSTAFGGKPNPTAFTFSSAFEAPGFTFSSRPTHSPGEEMAAKRAQDESVDVLRRRLARLLSGETDSREASSITDMLSRLSVQERDAMREKVRIVPFRSPFAELSPTEADLEQHAMALMDATLEYLARLEAGIALMRNDVLEARSATRAAGAGGPATQDSSTQAALDRYRKRLFKSDAVLPNDLHRLNKVLCRRTE